jgi:hypothetical protein
VLTRKEVWRKQFEHIPHESAWLAEGDEPQTLEILRRNVNKGLRCGSVKFVRRLERLSGRVLAYRPRGRPREQE